MIQIERYNITANSTIFLPEGSKVRSAYMGSNDDIYVLIESDTTKVNLSYKFTTLVPGESRNLDYWEYCGHVGDFFIYMKKSIQDNYVSNLITEAVSDCVQDLLYHNRAQDSYLHEGDIEEAVHDGSVTIDDLVNAFRHYLEEEFAIHSDIHRA